MKKLAVLALCIVTSFSTMSAPAASCKKNYKRVSCSKVKNAKRSGFCWKGNISSKKTERICQKVRAKKTVATRGSNEN